MALAASPPPQMASLADDMMADQLDSDIAKVRAEIAALTQRRSLLSASLLSSTKVQTYLRSQPQNQKPAAVPDQGRSENATDNNPLNLLDQQFHHNSTNIHRLAFGVTSFPFTDPNPDTSDKPLLGIRFDIPSHNGKFEQAPYYIFCKQIPTTSSGSHQSLSPLSVHHHTIPAFVPLQDLIDKHLPPVPTGSLLSTQNNVSDSDAHDEGYNSISSSPVSPPQQRLSKTNDSDNIVDNNHDDDNDDDVSDGNIDHRQTSVKNKQSSILSPKQNLHALVSEVYTQLLSHSKRKAAIRLLSSPRSGQPSVVSGLHPSLSALAATGEDCRFARLVWHDGLVGRVKISDEGFVERTVVFGEEGRMKEVERLLTLDDAGDAVPLVDLGLRLENVAQRRGMATVAALVNDGRPDDETIADLNDDDAEYEID